MTRPPAARLRRVAVPAFLFIASAVFIALALEARGTPYFPIDLTITRALQTIDHPAFAALMRGVSWFGFPPQVVVLGATSIVLLALLGLRREALGLAFAGISGWVVTWIQLLIGRPRPSPDLVHVLSHLTTPSFPSGHVMAYTSYFGFLAYVARARLRPSWIRTAVLVLLGLLIVLVGPSRIYLGHHWFSDVVGAYALGTLWLALSIRLYRWWRL